MPAPTDSAEPAALPAAADLAAAVVAWLQRLATERQLSSRTVEAYGRDARQFLGFLGGRRAQGIDARSLQRALSALRSLARHIARDGGDAASALGAIRAPKAA